MKNKYNQSEFNNYEKKMLEIIRKDLNNEYEKNKIPKPIIYLIIFILPFLLIGLILLIPFFLAFLFVNIDMSLYTCIFITAVFIFIVGIIFINYKFKKIDYIEKQSNYIDKIDSNAKKYNILFHNICKNIQTKYPHLNYQNKIIKEFVEQTNTKYLSLLYDENYKESFDDEHKRFYTDENIITYTNKFFIGNVFSNIPIKLATIDSYTIGYKTKILSFSGVIAVIDKKYDINMRIKSLQFSSNYMFQNDNVRLNLTEYEFLKCLRKYKLDLSKENELNITVDNDKFNRFFDIYSYNENVIKKIQSTELLDFITDFRIKYKIDFEIIFSDKLYIEFKTPNMFNDEGMPRMEEDYSSAIYYYVITKFIKELVEKLEY